MKPVHGPDAGPPLILCLTLHSLTMGLFLSLFVPRRGIKPFDNETGQSLTSTKSMLEAHRIAFKTKPKKHWVFVCLFVF